MAEPIKTSSGIDIPVVAPSRTSDHSPPGEYPFTRGIYPEMYRGRLWTMRQYAGYGTAYGQSGYTGGEPSRKMKFTRYTASATLMVQSPLGSADSAISGAGPSLNT